MCVVDMLHLYMRICDKLIDLLVARIRAEDMPDETMKEEPDVKEEDGEEEESMQVEEDLIEPDVIEGEEKPKPTPISATTFGDLKKMPNFTKFVAAIQKILGIRKPYYFKDKKPLIMDFSGERKLKLFAEINLEEVFPNMDKIKTINKVLDLIYR